MTTKTSASIVEIEIERIHPAPWNKARPIAEAYVETFRKKGQLVPGVLRPHPDKEGEFQIVAGHRRHMALQAAGIAFMRAEIRDVSEEEARELAALENKQREGLTPWQEAELIEEHLLTFGDDDVAGLAAALGMSDQQVRRRRKLLDLTPKWRKRAAEGWENWGPQHYELIARYPAHVQDAFHDDMRYRTPETVEELKAWLAENTMAIKVAPWKADDEALHPKAGACNACPKRSGAVPDLFEEVQGKAKGADTCLDPKCWAVKMEAHKKRRMEEIKAETGEAPLRISSEHYFSEKKDVLGKREYERCKKTDPGAKRAVIDDGAGQGTIAWVQTGKDKGKTAGQKAAASEDGEPKTSLTERKKKLEKRRRCHVLAQLCKHLEDELEWPPSDRDLLIAIIYWFGTDKLSDHKQNGTWAKVKESLKNKPTADQLWERVREVLLSQVRSDINSYGMPDLKEAVEIAAITSFDMKAARALAEQEIPVPKSWAAEKAEGKGAKPKAKGKAPRTRRVDSQEASEHGEEEEEEFDGARPDDDSGEE